MSILSFLALLVLSLYYVLLPTTHLLIEAKIVIFARRSVDVDIV